MSKAPEPAALPVPPMTVKIANALVTGSPLSVAEMEAARDHFARVASLLLISGPAFSASRVVAIERHNACVRRLRENREAERARAQAAADADLVEIEA